MRYLLIALVACKSSTAKPAPRTIVVTDDTLEKELFTVELDSPLDRKISGDCVLRARQGHAVVQCLDVSLRFDCADHLEGHPLGLFIAGAPYELTCK